MLFDLRSRGRRRTVQIVYLGLAVLMGGGLVLFGVGTGSGIGGLLNAFTGNGSGNKQGQVLSQQVQTALRETKRSPTSATAWGDLVSARFANASSNGFDTATSSYTTAGKKDLAAATVAWQRYLTLTKSPRSDVAQLAASAYDNLGQYAPASSAWEVMTQGNPTSVRGFECLAIASYAAKLTRKGDLATAKVASLVPKATRKTVTTQIQAAKTQPTLAQSC